jgi:hypothetical protein
MNGKIIITGTGRSGTTFLTQLLTKLGFDTGYDDPQKYVMKHCNAGYERLAENFFNFDQVFSHHVIKSPYLCDHLGVVISRGIQIDWILVPVRKLSDAAKSRERHGFAPGGFWGADSLDAQERILAEKLGKLFTALVMQRLSYITLRFPMLVKDVRYTYDCLSPLLMFYQNKGFQFKVFKEAFDSLANPDLVHE